MLKFLMLLALSTPTFAGTITLPKARTLTINGEVTGAIVLQANEVYALALKSSDPIYFVINSPGGSVYAGLQMLTAMRAAKSRGVKFHCLSTLMAASMAFQIYSYCDYRYAFENTLLLFHPMRVSKGTFTSDEMVYQADLMHRLEGPLVEMLIKTLRMERGLFFTHYSQETLWTAYALLQASPRYLTIVDDAEGLGVLFELVQ